MALRRAIAAVLLLGAITGGATAATFADGQRSYDAGRFVEAFRSWTALAEAGDPQAQAGLGLLYDLGQGVPADPATAFAWYCRAAEAGVARAQFNVAVMLDSGVGVVRDVARAATWYARAATHGHGRAQFNLAQLYASGEGVQRNVAQAKVWYRAAADGGLTAAADRLTKLADARSGGLPPAAVRLRPVIPVAPVGAGAIAAQVGLPAAELVWVAPPQPRPVRYFVQLLVAEGERWRELSASYVAQSAALVRLDPAATRYAWRSYAVAEGDSHYAVADWTQFTVR